MAKFQYKMQNILDIKQKLENQAKISYGQANIKLQEEQQILQNILVRKADYEQKARELVGGKLSICEIRENKRAIESIQSQMKVQLLQVQVAEKNLDEARKRLNQFMMERKTHEKLRERAFDQFKADLAYEENKTVDELVSYSYQNKID